MAAEGGGGGGQQQGTQPGTYTIYCHGHVGHIESSSAFHHNPGREPVVKDAWREPGSDSGMTVTV